MAYEDLLKDNSFPLDNKNYFNLVITDLNISTAYPLQFRWKYEDGSFSPWSVSKTIATPAESFPNVPSTLTVENNTRGFLKITWDGNNSTGTPLTNFDRVDIYISGNPFDGSKPTSSFFSAGTKTIVAPAGTYIISSYAVSKIGTLSAVGVPVTRIVKDAALPIEPPEDPFAPTITAGLASVIVSWNGKRSDGNDFTTGAFASAKVYIGTSSGFTPSADNWVHSLNFANGTNQVSIGVGTVIDKTVGTTLQYGIPYYIKIRTVNSDGTETSTAIASSPTNITVDKLPASEIKTGILAADASITAGASGGSRVVMSGAASPFIIYGTDGTTKLLEFIGGSTGTLAITGNSTFSGNLVIGSTSTPSVFKAEPATGIWLGDQSYASAPFRVSTNGVMKAVSGTIGGWTLDTNYLYSGNFQINGNAGAIYAGPTGGNHIKIDANGLVSYTGASPNSNLNVASNGQITANNVTISGAITATSGSFTGAVTATSGTFTGTINANAGYLGNSSTGWLIDSDRIYNNAASSEGVTVFYTSPNFAGFSSLVGGIMLADNGFQAKYAVKLFAGGSSSSNSFWKSQGNMSPATDGGYTVGSSSWKWSAIWSYTGTIQTSDQRLKTNILNSNLGLNFINALNPVSYKWIVGGKNPIYDKESNSIISVENIPGQRTHYGFIAQQVKEALDLVAPGQDFSGWVLTNKDDLESEQALRYEEFIAPIVKSIQELSQRLDALEG